MKQVNEFSPHIQLAALQYVAAYQKDSEFRGFHLSTMRQFDELMPELAECIDVLLWEVDQQAQETIEDLDAWHADHEHWTATH